MNERNIVGATAQVTGKTLELLKQHNLKNPPLSEFVRITGSLPNPKNKNDPLMTVQLFLSNSVSNSPNFHEGLPVTIKGLKNQPDVMILSDLKPITTPYTFVAQPGLQMSVSNTLAYEAGEKICRWDQLQWQYCGIPTETSNPQRIDEWLKMLKVGDLAIKRPVVRMVKFTKSEENPPARIEYFDNEESFYATKDCPVIVIAAVLEENSESFFVLPQTHDALLQYFLLDYFGLPQTEDARKAVLWSKVSYYNLLKKHQEKYPVICGGAKNLAWLKQLLSQLSFHNYKAEVIETINADYLLKKAKDSESELYSKLQDDLLEFKKLL